MESKLSRIIEFHTQAEVTNINILRGDQLIFNYIFNYIFNLGSKNRSRYENISKEIKAELNLYLQVPENITNQILIIDNKIDYEIYGILMGNYLKNNYIELYNLALAKKNVAFKITIKSIGAKRL